MTHEETIKRIQELTGGMALEEGCEVDTGVKRIVLEKRDTTLQTYAGGMVFTNKVEQLGNFKILGKPITLAVILNAIRKGSKVFVFTDKYGEFFEIVEPLHKYKYLGNWNLFKDNFNDQSEETKAFITNLLKK